MTPRNQPRRGSALELTGQGFDPVGNPNAPVPARSIDAWSDGAPIGFAGNDGELWRIEYLVTNPVTDAVPEMSYRFDHVLSMPQLPGRRFVRERRAVHRCASTPFPSRPRFSCSGRVWRDLQASVGSNTTRRGGSPMTPIEQVMIQMGYLQARDFSEAGEAGSCERMAVRFSPDLPGDDIRIIITPTSIGVSNYVPSGALVGIARDVRSDGFEVLACNSDCARGSSALLWIAVVERPGDPPIGAVDLRLGCTVPKGFAEDCHQGDWQDWQVPFAPTLTRTPHVFLTASNLNAQGHNAAAVGITRYADSAGFLLAARNSDTVRSHSRP